VGPEPLDQHGNSMNNKWHVNRDVIDVAIGHSAVVVASIEPDKIGRIIDASSSVKDLFKANKESLIGANIGIVMPNIIAMRHNDLIKGYHQHFKENIDHCITTYAKTLQDDYFRVKVTLHVSPLTHKGLNLVSYIRKLSEYQSLMIIDSQGNIIEYSKNLSLPLNLFNKRSVTKIETLCPQFRTINQAFDILFKPQDIDEKILEEKPFIEAMVPKSPKLTVNTTEMGLISPTFQRFALNSIENETPLLKSENRELSEYEQPVGTPKTNLASAKSVPTHNMTTNEAQEIWDNFKNNRGLSFYPYTKMMSVSSQRKPKEIRFKADVEALPFDGKWYKIIRLRNNLHSENPFSMAESHQELLTTNKERLQKLTPTPLVVGTLTMGDDFADNFPSDEERTDVDNLESGQNSRNRMEPMKSIRYVKNEAAVSVEKSDLEEEDSFEDNMDGIDEPVTPHMRKTSNKAQSVIDSQASQKATARRLNNSLKIEKQGKSMRFAISMVYLAVIAIICSICIYLIYTTKSLQEMEDSITLIQLVNLRLSKTILSLQAILVLYARSVKLRPIDYRVPKYQTVAINSSMDVLDNARKLAEEADKFEKKEIIESLYAKTVAMWEPLEHTLFDDKKLDQFSSNQILIGLYLSIARYQGSYLDLSGSRDMLFAINNTANDYLLTLDRSISDISDFFEKTKDTNTGLLKGIAAVEILFVVIPLVVVFAILIITVKLYSKLFNSICKIHEFSLSRRLTQLEDISRLFKESIEDDFTYFNNIKQYRDAATPSNTKPLYAKNKGKTYKLQNLLVYILKYVLLASILTISVIIPIALSLNSSTQHLENLDAIKNQASTVYYVGSQVKMMLPTFYVTIIFANDTSYKVRNNLPKQEMLSQLEVLAESTKTLLNTLTDEDGDISDPLIKQILSGPACQYVTFNYTQNCIQNTRGEEYALLGLQAAYKQVCDPMREFVKAANPTWTLGVSTSLAYANMNTNYHFVIFDLYDYLTDHLVSVFIDTAESYKDYTKKMFYECLAVFFAAMILIRVLVLWKLQLLDLGIRRILRIIPYKIIEENKVMSCYLARAFQNELKALKQLS